MSIRPLGTIISEIWIESQKYFVSVKHTWKCRLHLGLNELNVKLERKQFSIESQRRIATKHVRQLLDNWQEMNLSVRIFIPAQHLDYVGNKSDMLQFVKCHGVNEIRTKSQPSTGHCVWNKVIADGIMTWFKYLHSLPVSFNFPHFMHSIHRFIFDRHTFHIWYFDFRIPVHTHNEKHINIYLKLIIMYGLEWLTAFALSRV